MIRSMSSDIIRVCSDINVMSGDINGMSSSINRLSTKISKLSTNTNTNTRRAAVSGQDRCLLSCTLFTVFIHEHSLSSLFSLVVGGCTL